MVSIYFNRLVLAIDLNKPALYFVQDVGSGPDKGSFHVLLVFGGSFHVQHFVIAGEFESLVARNHALLREVSFIANQDENNIFVAVVFDVLDPTTDIAKSFFPGQVEHDQGGSRGPVIRSSDSSKLLLTSSVPNLQFDNFVSNRDVFRPVLNANGILVVGVELAVNKPTDQTGFTHSSIAHQYKLKRVIKLALRKPRVTVVHFYFSLTLFIDLIDLNSI